MTAGTILPVRLKRKTRRDEIFAFIVAYAEELDGPTPSILEIARHFGLNYKTVYYHVMKLVIEGRLRQERGKLVVVDSSWTPPPFPHVQLSLDF